MKKLSVLGMLILVAMFSFTAKADIVTLDGANEIANAFFANSATSQKKLMKSTTQLEYAWDSNSLTQKGSSMMKSVEEDPTFYVFNNPDGEGFVIVSGEEIANPIIGYSLEGKIDNNDLPIGFVGFMTEVDAQIRTLREYNATKSQNVSGKSLQKSTYDYDATTMGSIKKNLNTAPWGQSSPYNKLCFTATGAQAKTGCGPTAFAILCHYYKWPKSGVGTVTHQGTGENMELGHEYDYDSMRADNYPTGYTQAEADAVALLMRDLGWANQVGYGTSSTSYIETGQHMVDHFKFKSERPVDHGASLAVVRATLGDDDRWKTFIKNCLDAEQPIPYSSTTGGSDRHIYILDGYTDKDYYHFNWGWGGNYNGWFTLDNMKTPDGSDYTGSHKAYFNLIPNRTVTVSVDVDGAGSVEIEGVSGTSTTVDFGTSITLKATGDNFYAWMVNGKEVSYDATYSFSASTTQTYTAKFAQVLPLQVQATLDLVNEDTNNFVTKSAENVYIGAKVDLTAIPARGYAFDGWYFFDTDNYEYVRKSTDLNYTATIDAENIIQNMVPVYAKFLQLTPAQFTVTTADANMGTVTWSFQGAQGDVYAGEEITLTATPNSGYVFTGWSDGISTISTSKECTVEVENGKTYTATFVASTGVDYTINNETGGLKNKYSSYYSNWTINEGVDLQLNVTDGSTEIFSMYENNSKYRFLANAMDANSSYHSSVTYTLSVPEGFVITGYEMTYKVSSAGNVTISYGTESNTPQDKTNQDLSVSGLNSQTTTFNLSSATARTYIEVSNFVVTVASSGEGPVTPPTPTKYTASVVVNPSNGGTATVAVGTGAASSSVEVEAGTEVTFYAQAAQGYEFVNWTNGTNEYAENPFVAPINATLQLTANFAKKNYTVALTAGEGGKVKIGDGTEQTSITQSVAHGDNITITAVANSDYSFSGWTIDGSASGSQTPWTFPVTEDLDIVANFVADEPSTPTTVSAVPVFTMGENNSQYYRIPALVETANGTLVAIADNRGSELGDLPNIISIVAKTSIDGGESWSSMKTIAQGNATAGTTYGDAAAVYDEETGKIITIFVGNENYGTNTVGLWASNSNNILRLYQSESSDNGASWSTPKDISSSIYSAIYGTNTSNWIGMFAGSGSAVQLKKGDKAGRLMFVVAARTNSTWGGAMSNYAVYSDDNGQTWQVSSVACTSGDEAKIVELSDGKLLMSIKNRADDSSNGSGYRLMAKSEDYGASWTTATVNNNLKDPGCNGDVVSTTYGGTYYLLHSLPASTSTRENVTIYISSDNGQTWPISKQVYSGYSAYSSLEVLNDGTVGIIVEEGKWDDKLSGSDGFNLKYYSYTMAQLLNQEADPSTLALIETAKELKALEGVGYPNATAKATLQSAIATAEANPTAAAGTTLQTAITAYKNSTEIQKVEVGKAYAFVVALNATTSYYIYNNGSALALETYTEGTTELPETAYFTCAMNGDKYTFQSSDGKYMAIPQPVVDWLVESSVSTTGLVSSVTDVAKFTVEKLVSGMNGNVSTGKEDELFGKIYLNGTRGTRTDNGNLERGVIVVNSSKAFDKSNDPYYNGSVTSAIKVIERANTDVQDPATLALIETAKTLKALEGVGYPSATAKATLQSAIDVAEANPTAAAKTPLQTAIDTYKSTSDIVKPEAEKVYTFVTVVSEGTMYYIYNNTTTGKLALNRCSANDELPETAKFKCIDAGEGKYYFQSVVDNKYMAYPVLEDKTWLTGESLTGLEAEAGRTSQFEVRNIYSGMNTNVTASNDLLFGKVYLWGYRGYDTSKGDSYVAIVVTAGGAWDAAGEAYCNGSFTSAISIKEVASTQYTASVNAGSNGSANVNGSSSVTVNSGTQVTYTATANEGYVFTGWSNGTTTVSTDNPYTFNVTSDIELTANFREITLEDIYAEIDKPVFTHGGNNNNTYISVATINGESITVPATTTPANNKGQKQEGATAVIPVYKGIDYQLDLTFVTNWGDIILYRIVNEITNATSIYGPYEGSWTETRQSAEVLNEMTKAGITVSGSTATFPLSFNNANVGDLVVVRVVVGNDVNTPCPTGINEGSYVDFLFEVTATPARTVKIASNDINLGSVEYVSPKPEGTATDVTTSEPVIVEANLQPGANARFVNWTIGDEIVGEEVRYTYTGLADATIQANFEKIPEIYTVSVSSNNRAMGSATMSAITPTVEEGTSVTFTATAYEGYVFVRWQNAQGTQVSTNATYTTTINANTALTAVFEENAGLTGRWYRIKEVNSGKYLNADNYNQHSTGTKGGVNIVALNNNSNDQIFKFTASGTNYILKTRSGYNIVCQSWNVDALTSAGTALTFADNGNGTYAIKNGSNYFKVGTANDDSSGTLYVYCDAPLSAKATWVLEPVKISEVKVEKTSDNAKIKVTTDQAATIKVGGNGFGSTTAENLTAELTLGATAGTVGSEIIVESIDGYITSIECVENIELTDVPVTVTEIALRNVKEEAFVVNAPALSKITVVSDAENNVAKVSTASDLSQGVQVVVEKEIKTPHAIDGKGTPTYFNFLSMPFAFNTSSIKYWDGDSWEPAKPESQIRILMYDSKKRANGDLKNTWITLGEEEYVDIAANEGFVIVGHINLGDANHKMKLRFTSATEAYNGSVNTVTANSYRKDSGETSKYDTDWNFNGVPYLTNGVMNGYTLYFHNGYGYEAVSTEHALESEKVISAYQGVMYQANIESGSIEIDITPSSASRITKASDDVFARAYISVDDAAPAKIILSDESSENFVINEDAWYLAPTANTEAAAYFNIGGANASVTVQPAASELPMTVYTGAGTQHRITLATTDGNYDVYLKDAVTDEVVCLNNEDYTFTATAKSTIANRFTVSMVEPTGIIEAARAEGSIKVVVAGDVIKLFGTEEGDQVALYTANGMLIKNAIAEDGVTNIETSANGVIIIKVADETVKVVK